LNHSEADFINVWAENWNAKDCVWNAALDTGYFLLNQNIQHVDMLSHSNLFFLLWNQKMFLQEMNIFNSHSLESVYK